jgi:hypothetical protein
VADVDKERDWEKEMAEVDRLLKKLPEADPTLGRGAGSAPTVKKAVVVPTGAGADQPRSGGGWLGTWVRVVLGLLIGIGVAPGVWPYTHGCGLRLVFYLLGVTTVIAAGLWSSVSSWRRRLGLAHVIAQVLIVWGILLLTREVLPRVGARPTALWLCPDVPPSH